MEMFLTVETLARATGEENSLRLLVFSEDPAIVSNSDTRLKVRRNPGGGTP
jgi:hypothetical protein